jgi:hypothetical protein
VRIPPAYLRWAAVGTGVVLLAVVIAVLANLFGLLGGEVADAGRTVSAAVVTGAPCTDSGAAETVKFTLDGTEREARFDGCGHQEGELVEIAVPDNAGDDNLVVHAAEATTGTDGPGSGLPFVLIILSGMAGAGYAFLVRRGPRTAKLPAPLRLA